MVSLVDLFIYKTLVEAWKKTLHHIIIIIFVVIYKSILCDKKKTKVIQINMAKSPEKSRVNTNHG